MMTSVIRNSVVALIGTSLETPTGRPACPTAIVCRGRGNSRTRLRYRSIESCTPHCAIGITGTSGRARASRAVPSRPAIGQPSGSRVTVPSGYMMTTRSVAQRVDRGRERLLGVDRVPLDRDVPHAAQRGAQHPAAKQRVLGQEPGHPPAVEDELGQQQRIGVRDVVRGDDHRSGGGQRARVAVAHPEQRGDRPVEHAVGELPPATEPLTAPVPEPPGRLEPLPGLRLPTRHACQCAR